MPLRSVRRGLLGVLSPVVLLAAGCAHVAARGSSPTGTLRAFRQAIDRQDDAALYELLPEESRRRESLAQFRARLSSERSELRSVAREVDAALAARREPTISLPSRAGGAVTVVDSPEGWRLGRSLVGPSPAPRPLDAARALHQAISRSSLDGLLAALSSRARGAIQSELAMLRDALADPSTLELRPAGTTPTGAETMTLRLPDGRALVLVREGNDWRVDDLQER
jgi:hypothetical protein